MPKTVALDPSQLLGFRIEQGEGGAKIGTKIGCKSGVKLGQRAALTR